MRMELNDGQLEKVVGGTIIISKDAMVVGSTALNQMYNLKNCTYREARNLMDDMLEENPNLSNKAFDELYISQLRTNNWI